MPTLILIIISTFIVSLLSLVGILSLLLKEKVLLKALSYLVSLSAGGLMGGAFLHLIPEALIQSPAEQVFFYLLVGFFIFFIIEKVMYWRHCHEGHCPVHTFAYMNLIGDGIHNFIDGVIIALSFVVNINLGIITTLIIMMHELPQEIGDFGVLIYGGFKRGKALFFNFISAITAIIGGVFGYYLLSFAGNLVGFLLSFAAGGFIYIAASDLTPEIRKETDVKKSLVSFIIFAIGVLIIYIMRAIFPD